MSDLARTLRFSASRLSHAVGSLEARGWVRREPCPTDRRGLVAVLTPAGRAAIRAAAPGHVEEVRSRLFDRLDDEQTAALSAALRAMLDGLDPEGPDPDRRGDPPGAASR
jgi:DNA-binding MarR family transcriptional regulator